MRRAARSGWAFLGFAVALLLSATGMLWPPPLETATERVVMLGVRGLSWQVVIELIEAGKLPTLTALIRDEAAVGDIIATGYRGENEILASIVSGRFPFKQQRGTIWEELTSQGQEVSVSGFSFSSQLVGVPDDEATVRLLREEPQRHLFLYLSTLRGLGGEPLHAKYEQLDKLLGRLIAADTGESTFLLFSERGNPQGVISYKPYFPELQQWPAIGFFLAWGKHVKRSLQPHTVAPVDLTPTLLHVSGAKIPNDMDGLVLFQVFDDGFYHQRRLAFRP